MAQKKQDVIDLRTKVKVRVTEKNPHAETDTILEVHPIQAKNGFEKGLYEIVKEDKKK